MQHQNCCTISFEKSSSIEAARRLVQRLTARSTSLSIVTPVIKKMNQLLGYQGNVDTSAINIFLDKYKNQTCGSDEIPKSLQNTKLNQFRSDLHSNKQWFGKLHDIFSEINLTFDNEENSIQGNHTLLRPDVEDMTTFQTLGASLGNSFSLLDIVHKRNDKASQQLRRVFQHMLPYVLINSYKYSMMLDFYEIYLEQHQQHPDELVVLYKLISLTLYSIVEDTESFDITKIQPATLKTILDSLQSPPSFEICKTWMKLQQMACIFRNVNDNHFIVYNYKEHDPYVYVLFEFYGRDLVLMKQAKLGE